MKRLILPVMLCLTAGSALAFKIEYGRNVTISRPVYEDVYVLGGNVVINAPIHGDLVVAGGTIYINDTVFNDILLAGGTANFNGVAGDDIRCAGGNLHLFKNILGDLVVTGGSIIIEKNVVVGSIIASGGDLMLNGRVVNDALISAGKFTLNGAILKTLNCHGGAITINGTVQGDAIISASGKILIGDSARFMGSVSYWAPQRVDFKNSVITGTPVLDEKLRVNPVKWYYLGFTALGGLLWYVGMAFLMILITEYLFSATMKKAGDAFYNSTLLSLAYGFLFFIAMPAAILVAILTLVGIPVAIILLFSYAMLILLATVITSVVAANWLNNLGNMKLKFWRLSFSALGIFIILKILTFTPFFGLVTIIALVLISFGSVLRSINWPRKARIISAPAG